MESLSLTTSGIVRGGLRTSLSIGLDLFLIEIRIEDLAGPLSILSPVFTFVKEPMFSRLVTTPKR
jgi:hypothetical protein